ncbi:MAG: sulfate adenylyltransferase [Eubacterium sp.]|nr:sulfate adenylyltransferase [Eubacterium sp.]
MNGLLKFITCGSVDDGKSTLIGHILYDSKLLYTDQEKALELDSKVGSRGGKIDYSLLLDGLMAEREQGITIDVAYRYFTTDKRSFIVADSPGHEEYTRNMAVAASFADLAVMLIDATQGVLLQTRRHARICSLMGIKYFIFAVNKMDLVNYEKDRFMEIVKQIDELAKELQLENVQIVPVSATEGDNITKASENIFWYEGETLLSYLENVDIEDNDKEQGFYMPVQRVCRPDRTFRGFQGEIEAGAIHVGDEITTLPSNETAKVKQINILDKESDEAKKGQPVTIQLDREVDVSRGCVLTKDSDIKLSSYLTTTLLWMDDEPLQNGKNFLFKLGTKSIPGIVTNIDYMVDVNTGEQKNVQSLGKNEIAVCKIALAEKIVVDEFAKHKTLGEFILIDRVTNMTAACGVVESVDTEETGFYEGRVNRQVRAVLNGQKAATIQFVKNHANINRSYVEDIEKALSVEGRHTYLYAPQGGEDIAIVLKHMYRAGLVVLLLVDEAQASQITSKDENYVTEWDKYGQDVDDVARFICEYTAYQE